MAYLSKAAVKRQILFFSSLYEQFAIKRFTSSLGHRLYMIVSGTETSIEQIEIFFAKIVQIKWIRVKTKLSKNSVQVEFSSD